MKQSNKSFWLVVACVVLFLVTIAGPVFAAGKKVEATRISIEEAKSMLGKPDVVIIDVRAPGDWKKSDVKIKGAIREEPDQVDQWAGKYAKDKTIILYCA